METKKKKKVLNTVMAVLGVLIIAGGVFGIGHVKGWFKPKDIPSDPAESVMIVDRVSGVCKIERMGVGYEIKEGDVVNAGDILETADLATLVLKADDGSVIQMREKTEFEVVSLNKEDLKFSLRSGAALFNALQATSLELCGNGYSIGNAVFSAEALTGSSSIKVFSGSVTHNKLSGETETIEAQHELMVSEKADGTDFEIVPMSLGSLDDETIKALLACGWDGLCFAKEDLENTLEERAAETKKQQEEAAKKAEEDKQSASQGGSGGSGNTNPGGSGGGSSGNGGGGSEGSGNTGQEGSGSPGSGNEGGNGSGGEGGENPGGNGGDEPAPEDPPEPPAPAKMYCTIQIRCDTILNNWGNLNPDKAPFVPADGVILYNTTVEFESGQTVFDVLCWVCNTYGIQLEYQWTPMYGSYYIQGINHLYEFDCGQDSGWMYKVNGWFPNFGCSSYPLSDGDAITWCYTCNGLGADVQ